MTGGSRSLLLVSVCLALVVAGALSTSAGATVFRAIEPEAPSHPLSATTLRSMDRTEVDDEVVTRLREEPEEADGVEERIREDIKDCAVDGLIAGAAHVAGGDAGGAAEAAASDMSDCMENYEDAPDVESDTVSVITAFYGPDAGQAVAVGDPSTPVGSQPATDPSPSHSFPWLLVLGLAAVIAGGLWLRGRRAG